MFVLTDLFIRDFDFTITEVLLAHHFCYSSNCHYSNYSKGRKVSGIVYCLSGSVLYSFSSSEITLHPGEMLFLPENAEYTIDTTGKEPFHHITVNFNILPEDLKLLIPWNFNERANDMIAQDTVGIKDLLEHLLDIWNRKTHGYLVMTKALVYEITYKYFKLLTKRYINDDYDKLKPAKQLLDEQYANNIAISDLAAVCGFSETHFRRLFQKTFHCSPTEYRLNKRLLHAKELLLSSELTINEIAVIVGFEDANYFSRIFKLHVGMSPSKYSADTKKSST